MPCPDPKNVEETEWLSATEIEKIVMEPSRKYKHFGSGKLAKIFLEILSCDDLPNMEGECTSFYCSFNIYLSSQLEYELRPPCQIWEQDRCICSDCIRRRCMQ